MWYPKSLLAFFKVLNLLTNGNTEMQINVKFPITNLNKICITWKSPLMAKYKTMHTTMPTMSSFKIIQKKNQRNQNLLYLFTELNIWHLPVLRSSMVLENDVAFILPPNILNLKLSLEVVCCHFSFCVTKSEKSTTERQNVLLCISFLRLCASGSTSLNKRASAMI